MGSIEVTGRPAEQADCWLAQVTTCSGSSITAAPLGFDTEGRLTSWQNTPTNPSSTDASR